MSVYGFVGTYETHLYGRKSKPVDRICHDTFSDRFGDMSSGRSSSIKTGEMENTGSTGDGENHCLQLRRRKHIIPPKVQFRVHKRTSEVCMKGQGVGGALATRTANQNTGFIRFSLAQQLQRGAEIN